MAGNNDKIRELIAGKGEPGQRTFTESEKTFIYESMAGLIGKCAGMWVNYGRAEYDDLTQEGYFGLEEAMQHYEVDNTASFSSYAANWINCKMSYYSKKCSGLPVDRYKYVRDYRKAVAQFIENNNRKPTEKELAELMGVSDATLSGIIAADNYLQVESLESFFPGTDISYRDTLPAPPDTIQETLEEEERNRVLYSIIEELSPRQKEAIKKKYLEEKTVPETAEALGLTCNQVRGDLMQGLDNMRKQKDKLTPYYDTWKIKSIAYRRSGFKSWQTRWESSTEYAAIKELEEMGQRLLESLRAAN